MQNKDHHNNTQHPENNPEYTGLNVNKGIPQPPSVNPNLKRIKRKKKPQLSVSEFMEGITAGNITVLSQAVTLVESNKPEHYQHSQEIIDKCLPLCGQSIRIGITGVPGVGKSTFIESLGMHILKEGHKLAVLAIDPSSERTKGSILGDKTRMEDLSVEQNAYIRPSPSAGTLGGVARKTRETIILCEAAGFDTVFVETVGVGQSETAVHSMVDFFLLMMLAGAGDELQGIKRGIMEMADAITINKADGENIKRAQMAQREYRNALHLFPKTESGWQPEVLTCSALKNTGIDELWKLIQRYREMSSIKGYFDHRRQEQSKYWMYESINEQLKQNFYSDPQLSQLIQNKEQSVLKKELSSFVAAKDLLDIYFRKLK